MNIRRMTLAVGAATGGVLAAGFLQTAVAFAAPGDDAFTIGTTTFDPYTVSPTDPVVETEGFGPLMEGTGSPTYFATGSTSLQYFNVYGPAASGSTTLPELGSISTTENVTQLFGITNTGFEITGNTPEAGVTAGMPINGTVFDVTNYGGGYINDYTDIPGTGAGSGVTDILNTPFGDFDLSQYFSAFDLGSLDPGAAFGETATAAGSVAADAVGGIDPLSFLGL